MVGDNTTGSQLPCTVDSAVVGAAAAGRWRWCGPADDNREMNETSRRLFPTFGELDAESVLEDGKSRRDDVSDHRDPMAGGGTRSPSSPSSPSWCCSCACPLSYGYRPRGGYRISEPVYTVSAGYTARFPKTPGATGEVPGVSGTESEELALVVVDVEVVLRRDLWYWPPVW